MIKKLHESSKEALRFVPEEGQRGLLCSNNEPYRCPSLGLSDDAIRSLNELGEVLKAIDMRMLAEGYTIIEGKIKKLEVIEF